MLFYNFKEPVNSLPLSSFLVFSFLVRRGGLEMKFSYLVISGGVTTGVRVGRGHCTINYTWTQSFITKLQKSWVLWLNFFSKFVVSKLFNQSFSTEWEILLIIIGGVHKFMFHCLIPCDPWIGVLRYRLPCTKRQGSKGIRQWPINWCISPMMLHKIIPSVTVDYN